MGRLLAKIAVSAAFDIYSIPIYGVSAIAVFGGAVSVSFPLCSDSGVIAKTVCFISRR